jgi:cytochrome c553
MDGLLMRKLAVTSLGMAAIALGTIALAALAVRDAHSATLIVPPDPSTMDTKALVNNACSKCHGEYGVSISPLFPILAGQLPGYIEAELKLFRLRGRSDPRGRAFMWGIARGLTDVQIKGVAQYFSSQPAVKGSGTSNPALADKGKVMYENGAPDRDIEACTVCHGHSGEGVNTQPRLAGQHPDYVSIEMFQYRKGLRENKVMQHVTEKMTDDEIAAVVDYVSTL